MRLLIGALLVCVSGLASAQVAPESIKAPDGWRVAPKGDAILLTPPSGGGAIELRLARSGWSAEGALRELTGKGAQGAFQSLRGTPFWQSYGKSRDGGRSLYLVTEPESGVGSMALKAPSEERFREMLPVFSNVAQTWIEGSKQRSWRSPDGRSHSSASGKGQNVNLQGGAGDGWAWASSSSSSSSSQSSSNGQRSGQSNSSSDRQSASDKDSQQDSSRQEQVAYDSDSQSFVVVDEESDGLLRVDGRYEFKSSVMQVRGADSDAAVSRLVLEKDGSFSFSEITASGEVARLVVGRYQTQGARITLLGVDGRVLFRDLFVVRHVDGVAQEIFFSGLLYKRRD